MAETENQDIQAPILDEKERASLETVRSPAAAATNRPTAGDRGPYAPKRFSNRGMQQTIEEIRSVGDMKERSNFWTMR